MNHKNERFHALVSRLPLRKLIAVFTVVAVAVVGTILISNSHAGTPTASLQAGSGTITGNANQITDTSASGGTALKLGTGTTTGTGTCTDPGGTNYWANPSLHCFPDATNTGPVAGTSFASGNCNISSAGTYNGLVCTNGLTITASNVTVKNCKVTYPGNSESSQQAVLITGATGVTIDHCDINSGAIQQGCTATGIQTKPNGTGSPITLSNNNIYNTGDGIDLNSTNNVVTHNYVHSIYVAQSCNGGDSDHSDGLQTNGTDNTSITYNTFDSTPTANSGLFIGGGNADDSNITASNNLLKGNNGNFAIHGGNCRVDAASGHAIAITNNRIVNGGLSLYGGSYGGVTSASGNIDDSDNSSYGNSIQSC